MKTTLELNEIIENSPDLILYASPFLIGLAILEIVLSAKENKHLYEKKDFFASLTIGLGYLGQGILIKSSFLLLILWIYNSIPWSIPVNWGTTILCYILLDFLRYWEHKFSHEINFLWAIHVTHHSSTKFNFSTAFRQSWIQWFKVIFFLPISLLGFHPVVFFISHQIEGLYSFCCHTKMINKLPKWYSYIFVTPSHHTVHHGRNRKYLDKNYGSTFIIWDRIFNTFQKEEEEPVYGILDQPKTYNPVFLVFHVWIDIFKKIGSARSLKKVFDILFKPPGKVKGTSYTKQRNSKLPVRIE